jgi:hypothetical protein
MLERACAAVDNANHSAHLILRHRAG